jgi:hypothetical protein
MTTLTNTELTTMTVIDTTTLPSATPATATPKGMLWTGRVLTALIAAFMILDGGMKLFKPAVVVEGTKQAGFSESTIIPLGVTLLVSSILYAIPRTAVLGAILLTGYLGGAVATHVRLGDGNFLFAAIFGVVAWLGLYLRDARLRALVPLRRD